MSTAWRVLVCSSYPWSLPTLHLLHRRAHITLAGVVGRGGDAPTTWAAEHGVPTSTWRDDTEWIETLYESLRPDLVLCIAFPHRVPAAVYDACALGGWNVHPSLLPRWRGADPLRHAILAGDVETGVTVHALAHAFDTGPVLAQQRCPIHPTDTTAELLTRTSTLAAACVATLLDGVEQSGQRPPAEPQHGAVTLAPAVTDTELRITPRDDCRMADRKCRAGLVDVQQPAAARVHATWMMDDVARLVLPHGHHIGEPAHLALCDGVLPVHLAPLPRS